MAPSSSSLRNFSIDLCEKNIFHSHVVHQGRCQCCWALAAALVMEAWYNYELDKMKEKGEVDMSILTHIQVSAQELIECLEVLMPSEEKKIPDVMGCMIASNNRAFRYAMKFGLALEKDYPFKGKNVTCEKDNIPKEIMQFKYFQCPRLWIRDYVKIKGYIKKDGRHLCKTGTGETIFKTSKDLQEIIKERPIATALKYTAELIMFKGKGIFDGTFLSEEDKIEGLRKFLPPVDKVGKVVEAYHAVVIVGVGRENGVTYYKIKNTWGERWGDNGYAKILPKLISIERTSWQVEPELGMG